MGDVVNMQAMKDEHAVINTLQEFLERAKRGEIQEIIITARQGDGSCHFACSGSPNAQTMAGILLDQAILRLGYQPRQP